MGPPMDLAQVDKGKKPIGSSWKRIARMPTSSTSSSPTTYQSKRAHQLITDLEFERDLKKNKAAADTILNDPMKLSAEVALQPRWTP